MMYDVSRHCCRPLFGGGGFGLGTPVVSYAPRPMFGRLISLMIMKTSVKVWKDERKLLMRGKDVERKMSAVIYNHRKTS